MRKTAVGTRKEDGNCQEFFVELDDPRRRAGAEGEVKEEGL